MTEVNGSSELENIGYAHTVIIDEMTLSNHMEQNVSLRGVFTEFQMMTSIFEPAVYGSILVNDAHGLINRFPIVGEEFLTLEYKTPGNLSKKGEFVIYKISDERVDDSGTSSVYRLHFCSPEVLQNASRIVYKSFVNTDDSASIVKSIVSEFLHTEKQVSTSVMMDPGKKVVIPGYSPFEAIDMLVRRGYGSGNDYYLFFERMDGYWLKTLEDLVKEPINRRQREAGILTDIGTEASPDPAVQQLETWYSYASEKYQLDSTIGKDIRRILNMSIRQRFNTLEKISSGLYEAETVQMSIVDKSVSSDYFDYRKDGARYIGGTDSADAFADRPIFSGKQPMNTSEHISRFATGSTGFSGQQASNVWYKLKDPEEKDGVVKKGGGKYNSAKVALGQVQITIVVPGDTMVDAGDIVHLVIPRFDSVTGEYSKDKFLYGKYIVGSLRDSIMSPDKHSMTLDLYRDSYSSLIGPSELDA